MAYSQPEKAARELALELSKTYQDESDRDDIIRISEIVETIKIPLSDFNQLLSYTKGMMNLIRENSETARNYFEKIGKGNSIIQIAGVNCFIPQYSEVEKIQKKKSKFLIPSNSLHLLLFLVFILVAGCGIWIYSTIFLSNSFSSTSSPSIPPTIENYEIHQY
ncbi:MAG: hypothetical protein AAGA60_23330 [Cyanobacteria bacterium P01_E01_bin.42]